MWLRRDVGAEPSLSSIAIRFFRTVVASLSPLCVRPQEETSLNRRDVGDRVKGNGATWANRANIVIVKEQDWQPYYSHWAGGRILESNTVHAAAMLSRGGACASRLIFRMTWNNR